MFGESKSIQTVLKGLVGVLVSGMLMYSPTNMILPSQPLGLRKSCHAKALRFEIRPLSRETLGGPSIRT